MSAIRRNRHVPGQDRATDLSPWLAHLTRNEADLVSILRSGVIRAENLFGAGRYIPGVEEQHKSVCLTETPLHEISRMTARRPWGLIFDKERLRTKFDAQPVWYVSNPSPQWDALYSAMQNSLADLSAPLWDLTPFIDEVRDLQSSTPNDWRWEREWRVQGDLKFNISDVAMLIVDEGGVLTFFDEVSFGMPVISREDLTVRWEGATLESWDRELDYMTERFNELFTPVENAGLPWDSEADQYWPAVEILRTRPAMEACFGQLADDLQTEMETALNILSPLWCRTLDLNRFHQEVYEQHL